MTTTPSMGLVLPTDGGSANVWNYILDTVFGVIDGHTHLTGSGVPIVSGALNINADLSFVGNSATNLKVMGFAEQAAATIASYTDALWVNSVDHNLYFRNGSGVNVQITSGSTINVSVVGGIGGDYASVGALLSYDDATRRYLLQQEGGPRPWAGLATGDIDLYQKAASIGNAVKLKSPSALAASYTLTFPPALPISPATPQVDSAGNLTFLVNPTLHTRRIGAGNASAGSNLRVLGGTGSAECIQLSQSNGRITFSMQFDDYFGTPTSSIVGYNVQIYKGSVGTTTISAKLCTVAQSGTNVVETSQGVGCSTSANNPGYFFLNETFGAAIPLSGGAPIFEAYVYLLASGTSVTTDFVYSVGILISP